MHVEYDKLNFLPIRKNKNVYHRLENNCGDGSCRVIPDD